MLGEPKDVEWRFRGFQGFSNALHRVSMNIQQVLEALQVCFWGIGSFQVRYRCEWVLGGFWSHFRKLQRIFKDTFTKPLKLP